MIHHMPSSPNKMAENAAIIFQIVFLVFCAFIPGVAAFDAGDAIALVIGLIVGILGVCACLGYYARRRAQ